MIVGKAGKNNKSQPAIFGWLGVLLSVFLAAGSISLGYLSGISRTSSKTYAALMSVDKKVKSQEGLDFLHGRLLPTAEIAPEELYKEFNAFQAKTLYKYRSYNSFILAAHDNEISEYTIQSGIDGLEWGTATLATVSSFWDTANMAGTGIPLFWVNPSETKNNIPPKNSRANSGCYVSATVAEKIVKANGMLDECDGDLEKAFTLLLEETSYYFTATCLEASASVITFSINNIYIDDTHAFMLEKASLADQEKYNGNYFSAFSHWNKDAIFVHLPKVFADGSSYFFDVRHYYGNLDLFFSDALGYDYAKKGWAVELYDGNGNVLQESRLLNEASMQFGTPGNLVFAVLSVSLLVCNCAVFVLLRKKITNLMKVLQAFTPFVVFGIVQLVFHFILLFRSNLYSPFLYFNSFGNILILTGLVLFAVNTVVWSIYDRRHKE